jgi:CheY-like chemotaxis protein
MDMLLVEDEVPKQERILSFLRENWPSANIRAARSVRSAIKELCESRPELLLLDMSLPTFDVGPNEAGGRPQNFGGIEVLRYMDLYEIDVPTVVITAYEAFSKDGKPLDHDSIDVQLHQEHPNTYKGLIYYNSLFSEWRDKLAKLLQDKQLARGDNEDTSR